MTAHLLFVGTAQHVMDSNDQVYQDTLHEHEHSYTTPGCGACFQHRIPAPGMMCTLMYGICILLGQFTAKDELWKTVSLCLFHLAAHAAQSWQTSKQHTKHIAASVTDSTFCAA